MDHNQMKTWSRGGVPFYCDACGKAGMNYIVFKPDEIGVALNVAYAYADRASRVIAPR